MTVAGAPDGAWAQSMRLAFNALALGVLLLALGWAVSDIREVPADSRAVVLRFGAVVRQQSSGLLLAWPAPIEQVLLLPGADRLLEQPLASFAATADPTIVSPDPRANSAVLLTGDGGVVRIRATLFYQVTDPVAFLFARDLLPAALERLFAAAVVAVCAARDIDDILVARPDAPVVRGRERLRGDLVRAVDARLDALAAQGGGLGVTVRRIDVLAALPAEAKGAFDEVLRVGQAVEAEVAKARTYAEIKAQEAVQQRAQQITAARAAAVEVVDQAHARTAAIVGLTARANSAEGDILLQQTYAARMSRIMRRAGRVDAVDPRAGARLLLPGSSLGSSQ